MYWCDVANCVTVKCWRDSCYVAMQVNDDDDCHDYYNSNEPRPPVATDSPSSDYVLLCHPADSVCLCQHPQQADCLDSLPLRHSAGNCRHASTVSMVDSASLSSYNAVIPHESCHAYAQHDHCSVALTACRIRASWQIVICTADISDGSVILLYRAQPGRLQACGRSP